MLTRIVAICCALALPFGVVTWFRSHFDAVQHRYDVTLNQSMWVYLKDGLCGLEVTSMPMPTASRSEFHASLSYDPLRDRGPVQLRSRFDGPYRITWIVFPLWLPNLMMLAACITAAALGPVRRTWRSYLGRCVVCGYDLRGNRFARCSECGELVRRARLR